MKIVDNIHMVDLVLGCRSYVIEDPETIFIVDCGLKGMHKRIIRFLKKHKFLDSRPIMILLTHYHPDHTGCLHELKEGLNATAVIHENDFPYVTRENLVPVPPGIYGKMVYSFFAMRYPTQTTPEITVIGGTEIDTIEVIYLPGHTPGSVGYLHKPTSTIFSGDVFQMKHSGRIFTASNKRYAHDWLESIESIHKLANYEFSNLLPGHGVPLLGNASTLISKFSNHLRQNLDHPFYVKQDELEKIAQLRQSEFIDPYKGIFLPFKQIHE